MRGTPWTREEVEATVADYLAMLVEFHSGLPLNKAEHNRQLLKLLSDRTRSAIELKHQNISAVLVEAGLDYLDGYLPAKNYQRLLGDVVLEQLDARPGVKALITRVVESSPGESDARGTDLRLVTPPKRLSEAVRERYSRKPRPRVLDFDAIEAANRSLGKAGELAVLAFEHRRLWEAGKRKLAERIEHVAATRGDGDGYDVLSYEETGEERLIEVKTTRRASLTPFHVTRNEVAVSETQAERYHLYRLFRFERDPQLFVLKGSLSRNLLLTPTEYRAEVA